MQAFVHLRSLCSSQVLIHLLPLSFWSHAPKPELTASPAHRQSTVINIVSQLSCVLTRSITLIQVQYFTRFCDRGIKSLKPGFAPITFALRLALALCRRLLLLTLPPMREPYMQPSIVCAASSHYPSKVIHLAL
jgi:hypothetical protein